MKRIICIIALLLAVAGVYGVVAAPAPAHDRAAVEKAVLELINKARTSRGLHAVRIQTHLDAAAIAHSRQMLSRDYFSHNSASGASFAQRLRSAGYGRAGYRSWAVGEVIAWGKGAAGAAQVIFRGWMNSSSHRAVILDRRWRDVGIGCAEGSYRGLSGTLMYTVDFGRRIR
jgi:uncharacterized protein YkwD